MSFWDTFTLTHRVRKRSTVWKVRGTRNILLSSRKLVTCILGFDLMHLVFRYRLRYIVKQLCSAILLCVVVLRDHVCIACAQTDIPYCFINSLHVAKRLFIFLLLLNLYMLSFSGAFFFVTDAVISAAALWDRALYCPVYISNRLLSVMSEFNRIIVDIDSLFRSFSTT